MDIKMNKDGEIVTSPLKDFRTMSILGMRCILGLAYVKDNLDETLQLSLSADQCENLAQQLMNQAQVLNHERPTSPQ